MYVYIYIYISIYLQVYPHPPVDFSPGAQRDLCRLLAPAGGAKAARCGEADGNPHGQQLGGLGERIEGDPVGLLMTSNIASIYIYII